MRKNNKKSLQIKELDFTALNLLLLLLLLLLFITSMQGTYNYILETVFLGHMFLQLFGSYSLWCL
jgi:hypothetical protein